MVLLRISEYRWVYIFNTTRKKFKQNPSTSRVEGAKLENDIFEYVTARMSLHQLPQPHNSLWAHPQNTYDHRR